MKCKNIPDLPILEFLGRLEREEVAAKDRDKTWYPRVGILGTNFPQSVQLGMPAEAHGKIRLVRSKMQSLIDRGLVSGCTCGCRGDFELTEKGRALAAAPQTTEKQ